MLFQRPAGSSASLVPGPWAAAGGGSCATPEAVAVSAPPAGGFCGCAWGCEQLATKSASRIRRRGRATRPILPQEGRWLRLADGADRDSPDGGPAVAEAVGDRDGDGVHRALA